MWRNDEPGLETIPLMILLSLLSVPPLVINVAGGLLLIEYDGLSTCCFSYKIVSATLL